MSEQWFSGYDWWIIMVRGKINESFTEHQSIQKHKNHIMNANVD